MKTTIIILTVAIALFVAVTPVSAQALHEVKPACTVSNTWLDAMLKKCIVIEVKDAQAITPIVIQPNIDPQEQFPTMNACNNMQMLFGLCKE